MSASRSAFELLARSSCFCLLFFTGRSHVLRGVQNYFPKSDEMVVKTEDSDIKLSIEERINNDRKSNSEIMDKARELDIIERFPAYPGHQCTKMHTLC
jgi:hypothetical protein